MNSQETYKLTAAGYANVYQVSLKTAYRWMAAGDPLDDIQGQMLAVVMRQSQPPNWPLRQEDGEKLFTPRMAKELSK